MIYSQLSMQITKFPAMNNIIEELGGGGLRLATACITTIYR